jgi:hypothetical protein
LVQGVNLEIGLRNWKDEAAVAEVELKRPNPEAPALTCPVQQSKEVIVKDT